ncbi:MAG: integrase core domain-containing protein [Planctomycetota bacterium]
MVAPTYHVGGEAVDWRWRREYNHVRPHSSLGYCPPAPMVSRRQPQD